MMAPTLSAVIPGWVGPVGMLLGAFLVITWLARPIVLEATSLLGWQR